MQNNRIIDTLPLLYKSFLSIFFQKTIPQEVFSNCSNCSMICKSKDNIPSLAMKPFNENTKCCTYFPRLPNYLVGAILNDNNTLAGKKIIQQIIGNKVSVTPRGVYAPKLYELTYKDIKKNGFGRSESMLCPYYDKVRGNCNIWQYRNSSCSTYFCKHVSHDKGLEFWELLRQYLKYVEDCLVDYTLLELGFKDTIINGIPTEITLEEIDGKPPRDYEAIWNQLLISEEDFYIKSYQVIQNITQQKFDSIVGIKGSVYIEKLEFYYDRMIFVPPLLIKNPYKEFKTIDSHNYIISLDKIDTIFNLPTIVIDVFDGTKNNFENISILGEKDIEIDNDLLLALYNYDILIDANIVLK